MSKLVILQHEEIRLKLDRIAWQIAEEYYNEKSIVLVGIKDRGFEVAAMVAKTLGTITDAEIQLLGLSIDKDKALDCEIDLPDAERIQNAAVVLVDDVLNSGYTMSGAFKKILEHRPRSVKVAVLANRNHKAFPIHADFMGISMATTLKEHLSFERKNGKMSIYLI